MTDQARLRETMAELSAFVVSEQSVTDSLYRIADLAVSSVPPAMFAGITMMVDGKVTTHAFTDSTCPEIDQAQYSAGRGPCLLSFQLGQMISVPSLVDDDRWPEFASAAADQGVRCTLSLPLITGEQAFGALNFYAGRAGALGEEEAATGRLFAAQAAVVLVNTQAYWRARLKSEDLERALAGREVINLAKGIIMSSTACTPEGAFDLLVKQSQAENRKLREVAADIVAAAQRRRH